MQCTTNTTTFDRLAPYVCSGALGDERYSQCLDRFAANYSENRNRVPANFQAIFDNALELGTNLIFTSCNKRILKKFEEYFRQRGSCLPVTENMMDCTPPQAVTDALAQSMLQAVYGEHIDLFDEEGTTAQGEYRFHLWGGYYTYPNFIVTLADALEEAAASETLYINFFIFPDEESDSQCRDRYTAAYYENRAHVPPDLQTIFDNIIDMGSDLVYRSCNMQAVRKSLIYYMQDDVCLPITETSVDCAPLQDIDASIATCVSQARNGLHINLFDEEGTTAPGPHVFPLWGDMYTLPDFVAAVADSLSTTTTSEPSNYFISSGEGTVPQAPQTPPDETPPRDDGENVDRTPSEPDSPDGPPRGSGSSDDESAPGQYMGAWGD